MYSGILAHEGLIMAFFLVFVVGGSVSFFKPELTTPKFVRSGPSRWFFPIAMLSIFGTFLTGGILLGDFSIDVKSTLGGYGITVIAACLAFLSYISFGGKTRRTILGVVMTVGIAAFAFLNTYGNTSGLVEHDANVIRGALNGNGNQRVEQRVGTNRQQTTTRVEASANNAPAHQPQPAATQTPKSKEYAFQHNEEWAYNRMANWFGEHPRVAEEGKVLNVSRDGGVVLYAGSKGYYKYTISGIYDYEWPLTVLVDDSDGTLYYSRSSSLGAYDTMTKWYRDYAKAHLR